MGIYNTVNWEAFWNKPELQKDTAKILKEFVSETGKTTFTYTDVRMWYYGTGAFQRWGRDWHTIERMMRKLAEMGYLLRYRFRKTVRFVLVPVDDIKRLIKYYRAEYQRYHALGDPVGINTLAKNLSIELDIPIDAAREVLMGQELIVEGDTP